MATLDFNKAKVEKAAKAKERKVAESIATDNKSVIRAIARFDAAKEMYADADKDQIIAALIDAFYKNAKYQPSWDGPFEKFAPELGTKLRELLGSPSPRGRRAKASVASPPPSDEDPDAVLGKHPDEQ